jgi:energy-coupling factor transporter ATP-binding protein EcfA2
MNIRDKQTKQLIGKLADVIRAENISVANYLELYVGEDVIDSINNVNNQVIYGRRGSGKTHLLKALQEKINFLQDSDQRLSIYVDARSILPLSGQASAEVVAFSVFQSIVQSIVDAFSKNSKAVFGRNNLVVKNLDITSQIQTDLRKLNLEIAGRSIKRLGTIVISERNTEKRSKSLVINKPPNGARRHVRSHSISTSPSGGVTVNEVSTSLQTLINCIGVSRVVYLIDEWSEIPAEVQKHLAELIKRVFISSKFTFKIAAIPNRTDLGHKTSEKFYGLEDGGDIFGYQLDNRYIFEIDKAQTRNFFNDLLYKHMSAIDLSVVNSIIKTSGKSPASFINVFLTNKALGELCIASAGIPRDFINLFIHSYDQFKSGTAKHISVKNVRSATSGWYETDKKKQVDEHEVEKILLQAIVEEIVTRRSSSHFMLGEKHSSNPHILSLIDFRVLHLRKKGYSHRDIPGETFNVYSIDYGCYNHLNITRSTLANNLLDTITVQDDIRQIRRISLPDAFLQKFQMSVGEAFSCPNCRKPVDTNHLAYIKQKLCNNCYEPAGYPDS